MRATKTIALALLLSSVGCVPTRAAAQTFPDRGRAGVVDAAGVIPADQERALNERIVAWNRSTGHQFVVAIVPSLQGYDIKDYGYRLGRTWALGRKGVNDGAILLLAPNERKVRIEVGYGLEPTLTDALTSSIISDSIVPQLKVGDIPTALTGGAHAIMDAVVQADTPEQVASDNGKALRVDSGRATGLIATLLGGGAAAGMLFWFLARRRRRYHAEFVQRSRPIASAASPARPKRFHDGGIVSKRACGTDDVPTILSAGYDLPRGGGRVKRHTASSPTAPPVPSTPFVYVSPPPPSSSYSSYDSGSSSSSSSSSGFDSGGGSFGGGGSDSSY